MNKRELVVIVYFKNRVEPVKFYGGVDYDINDKEACNQIEEMKNFVSDRYAASEMKGSLTIGNAIVNLRETTAIIFTDRPFPKMEV